MRVPRFLLLVLVLMLTPPVRAQDKTVADGPVISAFVPISGVRLVGSVEIDPEIVSAGAHSLGITPRGLSGPGATTRAVRTDEIGSPGLDAIDVAGVRALCDSLAEILGEATGQGVYVALDPRFVRADPSGGLIDARPPGRSELTLVVYPTGVAPGWQLPEEYERFVRPPPGDFVEPETPVEPLPLADPVADGNAFEIDSIVIEYVRDHPGHPPVEDLLVQQAALTLTETGYAAAAPGQRVSLVRLGELTAEGPVFVHASGINALLEAVFGALQAQGLIGVFVAPDDRQIVLVDGGIDRRDDEDRSLVIRVFTSRVSGVRTIASGDRIALERRIDASQHLRIRRRSPLAGPATIEDGDAGSVTQPGGLLREGPLEAYADRLSRHPGRRVDVAIAPGRAPGDAEVQYLVRENKPWSVFYQVSNTGTDETDTIRQRFGYVNNQLTGADDILTLDYTTAGFDAAHALIASYERPVFDPRLRLFASGGYSEFEASDVGLLGEEFTGNSYFWMVEARYNLIQIGPTFVDVVAGARYADITIVNEGLIDGEGRDAVFLPRLGFRGERRTDTTSAEASVIIEWSEPSVAGTNEDTLEELGRLDPDVEWSTLIFDAAFSAYMEPLRNPVAYADPTTARSSTLAHEIAVSVRGQYAFNNRLIPNAQGVVGGLFSVRGYPESVTAGDSVVIGSFEYRYHVPRALPIDPTPPRLLGRPFRVTPSQVYGYPDWDLILKAFVDVGRTNISQPLAIERDQSLVGVGVGAELRLWSNLSFRTDLGVVLDELGGVEEPGTDVGDTRVHFLLTVLY